MRFETPQAVGVTVIGDDDMNKNAQAIAATQSKASANADLIGIAGAVLLGLTLLFAAGFAQASVLHDTAHDTRHAMSFPCH